MSHKGRQTQMLIKVETGLEPALAGIAKAITKLGERMSELTDSVDAALAAFLANEQDEDLALTLANETIAALQAQIDALGEGSTVNAENVAALEKVRDALLAQLPQGEASTDPEPTPEG